jgi:hypothetical protein
MHVKIGKETLRTDSFRGLHQVYVGQTGQSIETMCKEHTRHLCLYQLEKSAVAEHSTEWGHHIKFRDIDVLAKTAGYMDRLIKEAIEI